MGFLVALGTLSVEARYESDNAAVAATLGFVVFALFNVALGLTSRDETGTVLRRDIVTDRRQLGLYGVAIAVIILSTQLSITQRILDLVPLTGAQWMLCIACSLWCCWSSTRRSSSSCAAVSTRLRPSRFRRRPSSLRERVVADAFRQSASASSSRRAASFSRCCASLTSG